MKRCVYCGKEYPDDVTVCPVDQRPVKSESRLVPSLDKTAKKHRSGLEIRSHLAARPAAVKLAVGLLAFSSVMEVIRQLVAYHPQPSRDLHFIFSAVWATAVSLLILYFVFQGKNWARWLTLCMIILGTIWPFPSRYLLHFAFYIQVLIDCIAVVALFQRASSDWFKKAKNPAEAYTRAA